MANFKRKRPSRKTPLHLKYRYKGMAKTNYRKHTNRKQKFINSTV